MAKRAIFGLGLSSLAPCSKLKGTASLENFYRNFCKNEFVSGSSHLFHPEDACRKNEPPSKGNLFMVMCKVWRGYGCSPPVEGPSTQAATAPLRRRRRTAAAAPRKKYMLKFRITSQISVCGKIGRRKAPSNYHARTNANHHQHTQRYSDDAQHRHKNDHHFYRHNIITAIDVGRDIEVLSRSLLHSSFARPLHHRSLARPNRARGV